MNLYSAIFTKEQNDKKAVLCESRQLTYKDLANETKAAGEVLQELNVRVGDRVAILLNDSPEFISFFISICSLGAIAVPINMALPVETQCEILADCTASIAVVEADFRSRIPSGELEKLHYLTRFVIVERNGDEISLTIDRWDVTAPHQGKISNPSAPEPSSIRTTDAAFILYTSGSTGEPKGAIHSLADIFYTNETFCRQVLDLRPGDRLFSSSRLPFAYGLGNSFTFPLLNGVTSILCRSKPTPEVIAGLFSTSRPTIFFGVPVVYTLLLDYHRRVAALDCSSLRICISAGEALPARLGEEWENTFGVSVLDGIGSTEMLHMWMSNLEGEVRYGSSGKLLKGYDARLLDAEGKPTMEGQEGNLWVRGSSAATGYWQRPEATNRTFVAGWVRTGDLYRCDADGYWYHMGRSDDCFKSSGQWVSPVEVEDLLLHSPNLSRAAVVEDFDENALPCACAFVIVKEGVSDSSMLETELRELCRQSLPRHKQPRRYVFVEELPYTVTGKIQRFKLREELRRNATSKGERSHTS